MIYHKIDDWEASNYLLEIKIITYKILNRYRTSNKTL